MGWCERRALKHAQMQLVAQAVKSPPAMQEPRIPSLGREDPLQKDVATPSSILWLPRWRWRQRTRLPVQEMSETRVRSLGGEDPLEEEGTTPSSILVCRIPWTEAPGGLQSIESQSHKNNTTEVT